LLVLGLGVVDSAQNRELLHLARDQGKVLANGKTRHIRGNGREGAAELHRRGRLGIKGIEMACASSHVEEDNRQGGGAWGDGASRLEPQQVLQAKPGCGQGANFEEVPAAYSVAITPTIRKREVHASSPWTQVAGSDAGVRIRRRFLPLSFRWREAVPRALIFGTFGFIGALTVKSEDLLWSVTGNRKPLGLCKVQGSEIAVLRPRAAENAATGLVRTQRRFRLFGDGFRLCFRDRRQDVQRKAV